jgi:DNA-binding NtrC family response regulator
MNRYTVLLVDDEKVIREGCRRAFAASGFRVVTATNGREALEAMARERIDAILCDLKMPVMGAMGVLEQVTERYPEVPLIIITGQGTIANALECMRHGAYDFVTKPFRVDDLVVVVQRAIAKLPPLQRYQSTST